MEKLNRIRANAAAIREIVEKHGSSNPRLFGSTARGDDGPDSDIDILIDPAPTLSLFDLIHIKDDLEKLLGVSVDVVVDSSIPVSARATIEREAIAL